MPNPDIKQIPEGVYPVPILNANFEVIAFLLPQEGQLDSLEATVGSALQPGDIGVTVAGQDALETEISDRDAAISGLLAVINALGISDIAGLVSALAAKADLVGGFLDTSQVPISLLGALRYQTSWNAATNTPDISASSPMKGYYWIVGTAGATSLGGITDWQLGDHAVYNGTTWEKYDYSQIVYTAANIVATDPTGNGATILQNVLNNINARFTPSYINDSYCWIPEAFDASIVAIGAPTANTIYFAAFELKTATRVARTIISIATASVGSKVNVSVWNDAGTTMLFETGVKPTDSATELTSTFTAVDLPRGWYLLAWTYDNSAPRLRGSTNYLTGSMRVMANLSGRPLTGTAANSSTAGVFPSTLGTLSAAVNPGTPLLLVKGS